MKSLGDTEKVVLWKSKGLQLKNVLLLPLLIAFFPSIRCCQISNFCLTFKARRLNQKNTTFTPSNIIIYFYIYELDKWSRELNSDFNWNDCLFVGVKLAENAEQDKDVYSGYGIGFASPPLFPLPNFDSGKNVIIFGVDMGSSVHINNKKVIS